MKTILALIIAYTSLTANAQQIKAKDLYALLTGTPTEQTAGFTYVAGVIDASPLVCPTKGASLDQAVLLVKNFLKRVPQLGDEPAGDLVQFALNKPWPCAKGDKLNA